jgi:hypothetical protein
MIEHNEWINKPIYERGIDGQRIAIVGYSHYLARDKKDSETVTEDTIHCVLDGKRWSFFTNISSYFDDGSADFWNKVLFFNFIPDAIGEHANRYGSGHEKQLERGRDRVERLIARYSPDKLLVFSRKGWCEFPSTLEEANKKDLYSLSSDPSFTYGTYLYKHGITMAFGLRHPQFATADKMRRAVKEILSMPLKEREA